MAWCTTPLFSLLCVFSVILLLLINIKFKNSLDKLKDSLLSRWVVCSVISDKKSAQYGISFSYPIYILIVIAGILMVNPYILALAAIIAFLGIKLPIHPFDYIYNIAAKLLRMNKIPGRGSELQVNSIVSLIFILVVLILIAFGISINFVVLAVIYTLSNMYFILMFLFRK